VKKKNNEKVKTDKLKSIGKQSGESVESVVKKKEKPAVERKDFTMAIVTL